MSTKHYQPTPELRWIYNPSAIGKPYVLQQKWLEYLSHLVTDRPFGEPRMESRPGTAFEWRDVPTVPWRSNVDSD